MKIFTLAQTAVVHASHGPMIAPRVLVLFRDLSRSTVRTSRLMVVVACVLRFLGSSPLLAQPELPDFSAATFSNSLQIDNPYWPMTPGTIWTYEGETTDPDTGTTETESIIVEVLHETRNVFGIETRIVHDRVFLEGLIIEDTFDWYGQDDDGNIWYLGEEVTDFEYDDEGNLIGTSHPGQWEAGVDGALPGHIMKADPQIGENYYQEFFEGEAEDEGMILALGEMVAVPAGTFDNALRILDSSALFPQFGHKSYAPGIGPVLELDFDENAIHVGTTELVSVVPEPSGMVLFAVASLGALAFRPRR